MKSKKQDIERNSAGISRRDFMTKTALIGAGLALSNLSWAASAENTVSLFNNQQPNKSTNKIKTVLIINAHLVYPGMSEGTLNRSFVDVARKFFKDHSCIVLETKIEDGYKTEEEVEKHLQADLVILQTPVNWI